MNERNFEMFSMNRTALAAVILAASVAAGHAQTQGQDHAADHPDTQATQPTPGPAQGPARGPGMMGATGGMMRGAPGMMGGSWNTVTYLDSLKGRLAIKASQETAWKDYADTVSGVGEQMQGLHQTMFEAMGTASWQERRDMMNGMFQARQQAFDTVHAAAVRLLPSLDAAQKATAQQVLPGLAFGPGMMGRRGPAAAQR
jgi:hypothetical protein